MRADRSARLVAAALSSAVWLACAVQAAEETSVLLRVRDAADLTAVELVDPDRRSTRPPRRPVSDLMVLVDGRPGVLAVANGARPERGRTLFRLRLIGVSAGRLLTGASASCGPWARDRSICVLACDGGEFSLRRSPGGVAEGLDLVLGSPEDEDTGLNQSGLALGVCNWDAGGGPRLTPKAGRRLVELPLIGD